MQIREVVAGRDLPVVRDLLSRAEASHGVPPLGESKFTDLLGPRQGRGFVLEGDEIVEAYLHLLFHDATGVWEMELAAEPGIDPASIRSLVEIATATAGDRILWWTFGDTVVSGVARREFRTLRELHRLVGAIPPSEPVAVPEGLAVRAFRPGRDEESWLAVNNAAFAGHAENGSWSRRDLEDRMARSWFDPAGFRLAWLGDRLAGFCWTKRHDEAVGEIYVIGVDPAYQGRGIGRAIVIEGLWYLASAGCDTGMLYVDTANRSALRLYQSLGLTLDRVDRCVVVPKGWPHEAQ